MLGSLNRSGEYLSTDGSRSVVSSNRSVAHLVSETPGRLQ